MTVGRVIGSSVAIGRRRAPASPLAGGRKSAGASAGATACAALLRPVHEEVEEFLLDVEEETLLSWAAWEKRAADRRTWAWAAEMAAARGAEEEEEESHNKETEMLATTSAAAAAATTTTTTTTMTTTDDESASAADWELCSDPGAGAGAGAAATPSSEAGSRQWELCSEAETTASWSLLDDGDDDGDDGGDDGDEAATATVVVVNRPSFAEALAAGRTVAQALAASSCVLSAVPSPRRQATTALLRRRPRSKSMEEAEDEKEWAASWEKDCRGARMESRIFRRKR